MNIWLLYIIIAIILIIVAIIISAILFTTKIESVSPNTKLIFIHIPKTGGTTIYDLAKDKGFNWRYIVGKCKGYSGYHIPPDKKGNVPYFCVVRNPYSRIISEYKFIVKKNKSVEGLNKFIEDKLNKVKEDKNIDDFHWVPQHKYTKYCDYILSFENLQNDFDDLMIKYNINIRMTKHSNKSKGIKLGVEDISSSNIKKINNYYDTDFDRFGYKKING